VTLVIELASALVLVALFLVSVWLETDAPDDQSARW